MLPLYIGKTNKDSGPLRMKICFISKGEKKTSLTAELLAKDRVSDIISEVEK